MKPHIDQQAAATKPLAGVRILDFTRVLAGPYCTALLADVGAEVIKVEALQGDDYRHIGPFRAGESALFHLNNRNKKSLALDLKNPEGHQIAVALAQRCDVVVENFKPGVAKRLGIDYPALSAVNPKLVYASISGFGQTGPLATRPAFDLIAQAMSGLMAVTGEAQGAPLKVGESFGDLSAGLFAAWAIMTALFSRERHGRGSYVDVAMFDSLFCLLPTALAQWGVTGAAPARVGNRHPLSTPFGAFRAADGHLVIAALTSRQFKNLADALDCPDLLARPCFASDELRTENEPQLTQLIEQQLRHLSVAEAVARLSAANVPASPIWSLEEAIASPQVAARGLMPAHHHPSLGDFPTLEQPVHFSDQPRGDQQPAPGLGEHSVEILKTLLGMAEDQIGTLVEKGIVKKVAHDV